MIDVNSNQLLYINTIFLHFTIFRMDEICLETNYIEYCFLGIPQITFMYTKYMI